MNEPQVIVLPDPDAVARRVAEELESAARAAAGAFTVALAGGSTPRRLYRQLATPPYAQRLDWRRWQLFYGDERCVPPDHPESNHRMVQMALLEHVPIPGENVHRIRGEAAPEEEYRRYEAEIGAFVPAARGDGHGVGFSVALLGMGEDGHTASLFPGQALHPAGAVCGVARHPASGQSRISLTAEQLNRAQNVWFLVTGAGKAERLAQVIEARRAGRRDDLPAAAITPQAGHLIYFVDREAASAL